MRYTKVTDIIERKDCPVSRWRSGLLSPSEIITLLNLEPLPVEGGYFRQTYLAAETVPIQALPPRYSVSKPFCSLIYYLLYDDLFSAMHRLPTDEIYHHYLGDPVEMLLLSPDGGSRRVVGGSDLSAGQTVQWIAPAGAWQGTRLVPGGRLALLGTTMAPAYTPEDFELGDRSALLTQYPAEGDLIRALTRTD
jgi:predicted cupin superfamily sugar epimerase